MLVGEELSGFSSGVSAFLRFPIMDDDVIWMVVWGFNGVLLVGYLYRRNTYSVMSCPVICRTILAINFSVLSVCGVSVLWDRSSFSKMLSFLVLT